MTRQQRLNLVLERGNVSIAEVGSALSVSPATVRRDLNTLAEHQLVTRTHGGAAALGPATSCHCSTRSPARPRRGSASPSGSRS